MSQPVNVRIDSTLTRKISGARMSPAQRQETVNALHTANVMVDGAEWFVKKIEQLGTRLS